MITVILTKIKANNTLLEPNFCDALAQELFSIVYVHKSRKFHEPTLDYITLRNFGTSTTKIASKVAQDSKEKICESAVPIRQFIARKGDS